MTKYRRFVHLTGRQQGDCLVPCARAFVCCILLLGNKIAEQLKLPVRIRMQSNPATFESRKSDVDKAAYSPRRGMPPGSGDPKTYGIQNFVWILSYFIPFF